MKFIIIGPQNAITYKETFEYIKDNRLCDLEKSQLINKLLKLQDNLEAGI